MRKSDPSWATASFVVNEKGQYVSDPDDDCDDDDGYTAFEADTDELLGGLLSAAAGDFGQVLANEEKASAPNALVGPETFADPFRYSVVSEVDGVINGGAPAGHYGAYLPDPRNPLVSLQQ